MTPDELKKAFDDCAELIQEKYRFQKLCTTGQRVKLRASTKVYVGPTRVLAGWVVGTELQGEAPMTPMLIVHVKPDLQHAPQAHAIRCKVEDLLLEDWEDLEPVRFPADEPAIVRDSRLRHALWVCEGGKRLVEEGKLEEAQCSLGFVRGVMWGALEVALDDLLDEKEAASS
jgi:hypothetical protein